jgi:sulfur relay (sulfurtransferase) DsrC/TusE family protein
VQSILAVIDVVLEVDLPLAHAHLVALARKAWHEAQVTPAELLGAEVAASDAHRSRVAALIMRLTPSATTSRQRRIAGIDHGTRDIEREQLRRTAI